MTDLSVIILTRDEKLHIGRCLERLMPLEARDVFVIDCLSEDGTKEIVESYADRGVHYVPHAWPGVHSLQINWALDNCPIVTNWVLRLDADEYLLPETIAEIKAFVAEQEGAGESVEPEAEITLVAIPLQRTFWSMPVAKGVGQIAIPRIFKYGVGRCNDRAMDEKLVVSRGRMVTLRHPFVDDNLNGIDWWSKKHLNYAEREAQALIAGDAAGKKGMYARLPLFWRALAYFCYRYFLKGGFLEGKRGFQWHFFQGLWYRMLVDAKICEMKRKVS